MEVVINRQLAGLEDLLFGVGNVEQIRQGVPVTITKINAANLPFDETQSLSEALSPIVVSIVPNIDDIVAVAGELDDINTYVNTYYFSLAVEPTIISHPTLTTGDLYFDTVLNSMRVYDGTNWSNALTLTESSISTLTNKTLDDVSNNINANALHYPIKASGAINRGDVIYAVDTLGDGTIIAAVHNALNIPAIGIADSTLANNELGKALTVGTYKNYDATGLSVGQILYPDGTGSLTNTPTIVHGNYNQPSAYVAEINGGNAQLIINFHSAHESANLISYDNSGNGLTSTNIQDATDSLADMTTNQALAVGNINKPLLHLPLDNSLDFERGEGTVTFSRASTATYVDRYGVLKYASIDEPRFEKEGLLIEGASTNLNTYSEDTSTSYAFTGATAVQNTDLAPDGNTTADKLLEDTSTGFHLISKSITVTAGVAHTASRFIMKTTTETEVKMDLWNSTDTNIAFIIFNPSNGTVTSSLGNYSLTDYGTYWRVTLTGTTTISVVSHRLFLGSGASYTGDGTTYVIHWGYQVEELPFASSYIPTTTTAVTRSADVCSVTANENINDITNNNSICIDFKLLGDAVGNTYLFGVGGVSTTQIGIFSPTVGLVYYGGSSNSGGAFGINAVDEELRVCLSYSSGVVNTYFKGIPAFNSPLSFTPTTQPIPSIIYIGTNGSGGQHAFCHIKNLRIYDKALTAEEARLA